MSDVIEGTLGRHVISIHKQNPTEGREDSLMLAMVEALEATHGDCRRATGQSRNRIYDELDRHSLAGELALSIEDTDPAGDDPGTATAILLLGDLDNADEEKPTIKGYLLDPAKKATQSFILSVLTQAKKHEEEDTGTVH